MGFEYRFLCGCGLCMFIHSFTVADKMTAPFQYMIYQ